MTGPDLSFPLYDKYCKSGDKIKYQEILNDYLRVFSMYKTLFEKKNIFKTSQLIVFTSESSRIFKRLNRRYRTLILGWESGSAMIKAMEFATPQLKAYDV
ncbi:hypothetical protein HanIR_Chr02g0083531 [Helianthus annuus]|nr:hypothetical protein HanIR_Chr02g0083531 [Helianthus annuus]